MCNEIKDYTLKIYLYFRSKNSVPGLRTTNSNLINAHVMIIMHIDHKDLILFLFTYNLVTMCDHCVHKIYYVTIKKRAKL